MFFGWFGVLVLCGFFWSPSGLAVSSYLVICFGEQVALYMGELKVIEGLVLVVAISL